VGDKSGSSGAAVSVLFSGPKKVFKRAWSRKVRRRRMRESYGWRNHHITAAALAAGMHIDIALICSPPFAKDAKANRKAAATIDIPDFKTIDNAIATILEKILARS
jgi:hypothetical protein